MFKKNMDKNINDIQEQCTIHTVSKQYLITFYRKGIGFEMVINAINKEDAEIKANNINNSTYFEVCEPL
jgi:hypothetical protein